MLMAALLAHAAGADMLWVLASVLAARRARKRLLALTRRDERIYSTMIHSPHPHIATPQIQHHAAMADAADVRGGDNHSFGFEQPLSLNHVPARHIAALIGSG